MTPSPKSPPVVSIWYVHGSLVVGLERTHGLISNNLQFEDATNAASAANATVAASTTTVAATTYHVTDAQPMGEGWGKPVG